MCQCVYGNRYCERHRKNFVPYIILIQINGTHDLRYGLNLASFRLNGRLGDSRFAEVAYHFSIFFRCEFSMRVPIPFTWTYSPFRAAIDLQVQNGPRKMTQHIPSYASSTQTHYLHSSIDVPIAGDGLVHHGYQTPHSLILWRYGEESRPPA